MNTSTTARVRQLAPDSKLVRTRWLLANGAHEVELVDPSEATWQAYCKEMALKNARLVKLQKQVSDIRQRIDQAAFPCVIRNLEEEEKSILAKIAKLSLP